MRLEHYSVDKLKKELRSIAAKYLDLTAYKLFFFGSRLEGKGDARSDIDVGIEGPRPVEDDILSRIREDVSQLPLLYKVDVVDVKVASDDFRRVALQKIEWISTPEDGS